MFRRIIILLFASLPAFSQDAGYKFRASGDKLQDKDFYFFTLLETTTVSKSIEQNSILKAVLLSFQQSSATGLWSAAQIQKVSEELSEIAQQPSARQLLEEMRKSGVFQLYSDENDAQLLSHAWKDAANALNYIITGYSTNTGLGYPAIDSVMTDVRSTKYKGEVKNVFDGTLSKKHRYFYQPSLNIALELLRLAKRTEAVRYEPLEEKLNKEALVQVRKTDWNNYQYPVMLVLGASPSASEPLSAMGQSRCDIAAKLYHQHLAPFIIVSGGHVRPSGTQYAEAIEMKRYLVEKQHVPASAVLVDPYARHTTTNIRNAVRIMYRDGIPTNKAMMCVSDSYHLLYVSMPMFAKRCQTELGYLPMKEVKQADANYLTFLPDLNALQINSRDPLDP